MQRKFEENIELLSKYFDVFLVCSIKIIEII